MVSTHVPQVIHKDDHVMTFVLNCCCCVTNYPKFSSLKTTQIEYLTNYYYYLFGLGVQAWLCWVLCSRAQCWPGPLVSSELLPSSLVVGRIKFLAVVGLGPLATRDYALFPATWAFPHSSLLLRAKRKAYLLKSEYL